MTEWALSDEVTPSYIQDEVSRMRPLLFIFRLCTAKSKMGKEGEIALPVSHESAAPTKPKWFGKTIPTWAAVCMLALSGLSAYVQIRAIVADWNTPGAGEYISTSCHQAEPLLPKGFDPSSAVQGQEGRIRDWLSGAVKIPTEMFDVMGPIGEDHRWDIFYNFSDCQSSLLLSRLDTTLSRS